MLLVMNRVRATGMRKGHRRQPDLAMLLSLALLVASLLLSGLVPSTHVAALARDQAAHLPRATLVLLDDAGREQARLVVELATTTEARARGLMFRRHLAADEGMLFLWPAPRPVAMWMKNTFIPLDMVFIGADGRVVRVHENARPHDLTPISSGAPVMAVLEVNAGAARRLGLRRGVRLRLPSLSATR